VRYSQRLEQLLLLTSLIRTKYSQFISCTSELFERSAFISICVSCSEQLVTRTAQNTRIKCILYRNNGNVEGWCENLERSYVFTIINNSKIIERDRLNVSRIVKKE
jgi:hypothetical protein